jgi:hypothetical protein
VCILRQFASGYASENFQRCNCGALTESKGKTMRSFCVVDILALKRTVRNLQLERLHRIMYPLLLIYAVCLPAIMVYEKSANFEEIMAQ